jgi:hypothetical protein
MTPIDHGMQLEWHAEIRHTLSDTDYVTGIPFYSDQ